MNRIERLVWGIAQTPETVLITRGLTDAKANPTLATGDVKISKDGGAFANLTTLPTVTPASGVRVAIALSATECEATRLTITFIDQTSPKEWEDRVLHFDTQLADGGVVGKITSGSPSTTSFISTQLTGANTDHYKARWVRFLSGACAGSIARISAFNASTDTVTLDSTYPLPTAPAVGDVFELV